MVRTVSSRRRANDPARGLCDDDDTMDGGVGVKLIRVLGSVEILLDDGRCVMPPSVTQRRLLAALAQAATRSVPIARLADVAELTPNAVRVAIGRLRRIAPGDWLRTGAAGYLLAVDTDASLMCAELARVDDDPTALQRALTWWGGAPYEEFGHEPWAVGEATRLGELHAWAVEDRAEQLLDAGAVNEVVVLMEAHVASSPWRERSWGLLLRGLAAGGRQVEALRAYQRHRDRLIDETGTEPSDDLRRIEQRIAAGWDGRSGSVPTGGARGSDPVASTGRRTPNAVATPPTIGRDDELERLLRALEHVHDGGTTACLVGDAGIGKTWLLDTFARRARDAGALVVSARCDEAAGGMLQPFRSIVEQLVSAAPPEIIADHVRRRGNRIALLAPRAPDLGETNPIVTDDDATARFLLFEAIGDLLASVASTTTVVLAVDDLHWAAATSLALVRHLAATIGHVPVLFLVATRDPRPDADDALRATLSDLARRNALRIDIAPFGPDELRQLVRVALESDRVDVVAHVVDVLAADTNGNPLLATHVVRQWLEDGVLRVERGRAVLRDDRAHVAPALRDLVWARLRSLDVAATDVLTAAAILGEPIVEPAIVDISGAAQGDVERVLDVAAGAGILVDGSGPSGALGFAHGLIARAVVQDLTPSKRRRLHERAARALERLSDDEPAATAARIAHHFEQAGRPTEALTWSLRAGDEAASQLAGAEAAAWFLRALDHATAVRADDGVRADVLVRLGEAEQRAGIAGGLDRLVEAGELARRSGRADCLVRAALSTDRGFVRLGDFVPTQLGLVEAALAVVDPGDADTRARLLALLGECLVGSSDVERREAAAREALAVADTSTDPTLIGRIAPAILYALWTPRMAALRRSIGERAVASAMTTRDPHLHFLALSARHSTQVVLGDATGARRSLTAMRELVAGHPEPRMRWSLGSTETYQATMAADFADAERRVDETFALGTAIGERDAFNLYAGQLYVLRTFEGRHGEMLPLVEQVIAAGQTPLPFRLAFGIACAAVGRPEPAAELLALGSRRGFTSVPQDLIWLTTIVGYAVLAIELGDVAAAAALHPLLEPYADQVAFNGVTSQGPVAAYVGKLASMLGEHDEADANLGAALATADAFGWEYHRATTLFALAESRVRRVGQIDRTAEEFLDVASRICAERGIANWAAKIQRLPLDVARRGSNGSPS